MINNLFIFLLKIYKYCLSPFLGSNCRFTPTCSSYAIYAFGKHGFLKAIFLVARRLIKCHPFHPGGYDPV